MSTPDRAIWEELDAYASRLDPKLAQAFRRAVEHLKTGASPELLEEVVRTNNPDLLLQHLDLGEFRTLLRDVILGGAERVPGLLNISFNLFNPYVLTALRASEVNLVAHLTSDMRAGIQQHLAVGLQQGINPRETAIQLRPLVGMSAKDTQAVANYRRLLTGGAKGQPLKEALSRGLRDRRFDRSIISANAAKVQLSPTAVEAHVKRFEERLIKHRAETVARTESISALALGQHLKWRQAIGEGAVEERQLRRFWFVAPIEGVCPVCKAIPVLNPDGVAFEEPFVLADGSVLMRPTAHPNCRCVVFIRLVIS